MNPAVLAQGETPEAAAEFRRRARRARDLAHTLIGDPAEKRLLLLAEEYEERAAKLESQQGWAEG